MKKYLKIFSENSISSKEQLERFTNADWKNLDLPSVIEDAIKQELKVSSEILPPVSQGSSSGMKLSKKNEPKVTSQTTTKPTIAVKSNLIPPPPSDVDPWGDLEVDNITFSSKAKVVPKNSTSKNDKQSLVLTNAAAPSEESILNWEDDLNSII